MFPQPTFTYSLLISIKFFSFLKKKKRKESKTNKEKSYQKTNSSTGKGKNGICSLIVDAWKCMSICFLNEIFFKSPLTTFQLIFSLCLDFVALSYHSESSHRTKITLKGSFYVSISALIILQILTVKKNLPELCLVSKQRNDIFHLLSIMGHHAHLIPFLEGACWKALRCPCPPPTRQEQDATTTFI